MHIVFLVQAFPMPGGSPAGGAGSYVSNMARIMHMNGHQVSIITEAYEDKEYDLDGVTLYRISATRGFSRAGLPMPTYKKVLKNLSRSYWYNRKVKQIHKKSPVDIVQSVNCYALALLRRRDIPYLVRGSEDPYIWWSAEFEGFDYNKAVNLYRMDMEMLYWAMRRADEVIVPSFFLRDIIKKKIGMEPRIIESPVLVDAQKVYPFNEPDIEKNKYLLTFGAMSYRKEIKTLARIIDSLLDEYPEMKYIMAGGDKKVWFEGRRILVSDMFKEHIVRNSERFVLLGEITDRDRLFSLIQNAKICILPTCADNLPNTCLEAMAFKKIVVSSTSDYGTSVEQLIVDGENGFLARVGNSEELYEKVKCAMKLSNEDAVKMEQAAYDRVKDLTPDKVYQKMIGLYREIIESKRRKK